MIVIDLLILVGLVATEVLLAIITSGLFLKNYSTYNQMISQHFALVIPPVILNLIEMISCGLFAVGLQSYVLSYNIDLTEFTIVTMDAPVMYIIGISVLAVLLVSTHAWEWVFLREFGPWAASVFAVINALAILTLAILSYLQSLWLCMSMFIVMFLWALYKVAMCIAVSFQWKESQVLNAMSNNVSGYTSSLRGIGVPATTSTVY